MSVAPPTLSAVVVSKTLTFDHLPLRTNQTIEFLESISDPGSIDFPKVKVTRHLDITYPTSLKADETMTIEVDVRDTRDETQGELPGANTKGAQDRDLEFSNPIWADLIASAFYVAPQARIEKPAKTA